jgi:hypothetical protein
VAVVAVVMGAGWLLVSAPSVVGAGSDVAGAGPEGVAPAAGSSDPQAAADATSNAAASTGPIDRGVTVAFSTVAAALANQGSAQIGA